ncbi:hypothetical protein BGX38DRAFT_1161767 [Terfezia claveryi]|nr:hypothetical protein BGX38DRAFT_1161767 [Terfezia claveryi]
MKAQISRAPRPQGLVVVKRSRSLSLESQSFPRPAHQSSKTRRPRSWAGLSLYLNLLRMMVMRKKPCGLPPRSNHKFLRISLRVGQRTAAAALDPVNKLERNPTGPSSVSRALYQKMTTMTMMSRVPSVRPKMLSKLLVHQEMALALLSTARSTMPPGQRTRRLQRGLIPNRASLKSPLKTLPVPAPINPRLEAAAGETTISSGLGQASKGLPTLLLAIGMVGRQSTQSQP